LISASDAIGICSRYCLWYKSPLPPTPLHWDISTSSFLPLYDFLLFMFSKWCRSLSVQITCLCYWTAPVSCRCTIVGLLRCGMASNVRTSRRHPSSFFSQ
jgi:hypothetical protein